MLLTRELRKLQIISSKSTSTSSWNPSPTSSCPTKTSPFLALFETLRPLDATPDEKISTCNDAITQQKYIRKSMDCQIFGFSLLRIFRRVVVSSVKNAPSNMNVQIAIAPTTLSHHAPKRLVRGKGRIIEVDKFIYFSKHTLEPASVRQCILFYLFSYVCAQYFYI